MPWSLQCDLVNIFQMLKITIIFKSAYCLYVYVSIGTRVPTVYVWKSKDNCFESSPASSLRPVLSG